MSGVDLDPNKVLCLFGTLGYLVSWLALCVLINVLLDRRRK